MDQDHPRECGKNFVNNQCGCMPIGSPPRVREKPLSNLQFFLGLGITPASAGKTFALTALPSCAQDHPRECGKNKYHLTYLLNSSGSPPRVREKLNSYLSITIYFRITPASAGKTSREIAYRIINRDHPRECGKNAFSKLL